MRQFFIGDVHGCLDELRDLMPKLSLARGDRVCFLGDLVDRGPDPVGVVHFVQALRANEVGYEVVGIQGNHEEKCLRWRRHQAKVASGEQRKNPMKPVDPARKAQWEALSEADVAFLAAQPLTLDLNPERGLGVGDEHWVAVHGGLLPGRALADQERKHAGELIRCRWVDPGTGKHVGMVDGKMDMPEGARPWMEVFDGEYHVVCGHAVHSLDEPRVDRTLKGFEVWSVDTGCCFGGHLSALVLDSARPGYREVVQVKAQRAYAKLVGSGVEG